MELSYHGGKLLSPAWQGLFEKKLNKVFPQIDKSATVDVYLSTDNKQFLTKVKVTSKNKDIIASAKSNDMYRNIDICIKNLKTQLRDIKDLKDLSHKVKEEFEELV